MKSLVALATFLTVAVLLTAAAAPQGGGVPTAVHYIDHDQVSAMMATDGPHPIVNDPGLRVSITRRGAGPVEYHEHNNHIFIMIEGEATFVTGGTMVDAKRTSPDEVRAASIEGGETHHLSKGDLLTIPAKTPHWWKEVPTKTVVYYEFNMTAPPQGGGVPTAVHYTDHDKISAMMTTDGTHTMVDDPDLIVELTRRRGAGQVEYHEHNNHIFIMVEGEATMVTGGTMVDAKPFTLNYHGRIESDEMLAASIQAGETHHLSKGDVLTIPAKTPHWWKETPTTTFCYFAVNIQSQ